MLNSPLNQTPTPNTYGSGPFSAIGSTVFDRLRNLFSGRPGAGFSLETVIGYHWILWTNQQTYYTDLQQWYDGIPLNEVIENPATKKKVEKFPLHINPIKDSCEKHTTVLFGNTLDGIRFGGVPIQFIVDDNKISEEKKKQIEDALIDVFQNSGGGSIFLQNGIRSQYLGGSVWAASFHPEQLGAEIRVETPSPVEFLGIPEYPGSDKLREAWIIREISIADAMALGYPMTTPMQAPYYYIEYWDKEKYSIRINEWVIESPSPTYDPDSNTGAQTAIRYEGVNPFGIVPMVYVPHIRVRSFLGTSIITDTVKGVIKELNLRFADVGDAVNDDSHVYIAARNVKGGIKATKLPDGRSIIDLGSTTGLGGASESSPDLFAVQPKSASEPMLKFIEKLEKIYRKEAKHPAVADGEDEGSQRSSLTLITRMWPLVSHVELERINWTTGMLQLIQIILTMMAVKGLNGITMDDVKTSIIIKWPQMLPKDREALLNEVNIRANANLGSPEHLIELLADVYDIPGEVERIKEWVKWQADNAAPPAPFGGSGGKVNSAPKDPGGPKGESAPKQPSGSQ